MITRSLLVIICLIVGLAGCEKKEIVQVSPAKTSDPQPTPEGKPKEKSDEKKPDEASKFKIDPIWQSNETERKISTVYDRKDNVIHFGDKLKFDLPGKIKIVTTCTSGQGNDEVSNDLDMPSEISVLQLLPFSALQAPFGVVCSMNFHASNPTGSVHTFKMANLALNHDSQANISFVSKDSKAEFLESDFANVRFFTRALQINPRLHCGEITYRTSKPPTSQFVLSDFDWSLAKRSDQPIQQTCLMVGYDQDQKRIAISTTFKVTLSALPKGVNPGPEITYPAVLRYAPLPTRPPGVSEYPMHIYEFLFKNKQAHPLYIRLPRIYNAKYHTALGFGFGADLDVNAQNVAKVCASKWKEQSTRVVVSFIQLVGGAQGELFGNTEFILFMPPDSTIHGRVTIPDWPVPGLPLMNTIFIVKPMPLYLPKSGDREVTIEWGPTDQLIYTVQPGNPINAHTKITKDPDC